MAFRRPSASECDRSNPDHWCVRIDGADEPLEGIQCPSCGASGEDLHHAADLDTLRWTCPQCGHSIPIIPAQVEE